MTHYTCHPNPHEIAECLELVHDWDFEIGPCSPGIDVEEEEELLALAESRHTQHQLTSQLASIRPGSPPASLTLVPLVQDEDKTAAVQRAEEAASSFEAAQQVLFQQEFLSTLGSWVSHDQTLIQLA